jgi:acyl-CoA thioesterase
MLLADQDAQVLVQDGSVRRFRCTTTQQSLWFHRRPRADRWQLLVSRAPSGLRLRRMVHGKLTEIDGTVIAAVVR